MDEGGEQMKQVIRAHFDGKVIVPDEPVDWPVGVPLELSVTLPATRAIPPDDGSKEAALCRILGRAAKGPDTPESSP